MEAETVTTTDPSADSTAPNDVLRVRGRNTGPRIKAVATYRDLRRGHLGASLRIDPGKRGGTKLQLMRYQDFDGDWKEVMLYREGNWRTVKCPGKRASADADRDRIALSLPRTCLGKFRTAKKAHFQIIGGQQEGGGVPREFAPEVLVLVRKG